MIATGRLKTRMEINGDRAGVMSLRCRSGDDAKMVSISGRAAGVMGVNRNLDVGASVTSLKGRACRHQSDFPAIWSRCICCCSNSLAGIAGKSPDAVASLFFFIVVVVVASGVTRCYFLVVIAVFNIKTSLVVVQVVRFSLLVLQSSCSSSLTYLFIH